MKGRLCSLVNALSSLYFLYSRFLYFLLIYIFYTPQCGVHYKLQILCTPTQLCNNSICNHPPPPVPGTPGRWCQIQAIKMMNSTTPRVVNQGGNRKRRNYVWHCVSCVERPGSLRAPINS